MLSTRLPVILCSLVLLYMAWIILQNSLNGQDRCRYLESPCGRMRLLQRATFICVCASLCVLFLVSTLAALVSLHQSSLYALACDTASRINTRCACLINAPLYTDPHSGVVVRYTFCFSILFVYICTYILDLQANIFFYFIPIMPYR